MNISLLLINGFIIILTIIGLWYGAVMLVDSAARLARRVGLSELVIGLTVVALGTSAPEFAVTTTAALNGQANISVGNVVGSNIFNLGFILGGVVLIRAISTTSKLVYRDGVFLVATSFLLLWFMRDLTLQPVEGVVFLLLLLLYIGYLIYQREAPDEELPAGDFSWWDIPKLIIGIGIVLVSARFLVDSATLIAFELGVREWVIAVTVVAAGTSAPEMATSFVAVVRGHSSISVGNLIGSDIFNKLGVLGLAALLQTQATPLIIDEAGWSSLLLLCLMVSLVLIMMRTGWRLTRWEGGLLVGINLVRWVFDFSAPTETVLRFFGLG